MTPKEFADKMKSVCDRFDDDTEMKHIYMDDCMCELLTELGYGDGIDIFNSQYKWYA